MDLKHKYASLPKDDLIKLLLERRPEGIDLVFAGKNVIRHIARKVRPKAMRVVSELCAGHAAEQARNLVIEGDNLAGMVSLYKFHGAVDLVLADPPFNTGGDFRYNDKWDEDPNDPDPGTLVTLEDGSRFTKWMKYMLPRLQLMRALLKPNGVVAICIDHRELFRLGMLMNEVFGEGNRVGILNWQRTYSPKNNVKTHLSHSTEYILVYAKNTELAKTALLPRSESMDAKYKNPDGDPDGPWRSSDVSGPGASTHKGQVYAIQSPFTGKMHYPPLGRCWAAERRRVQEWLEGWGVKYRDKQLDDGNVPALVIQGSVAAARKAAKRRYQRGHWPDLIFLDEGEGGPAAKKHLEKVKQGLIPLTFWADEEYETPFQLGSASWKHAESGHSQQGINELTAIVGRGDQLETVKPLKLFAKIITLWCPPNGLVIDPFAGSGTTGHAILQLNEETGASRRFVLMEQGRADRDDRYARTLLANRLKRVISGNWASGKRQALQGGFRFLTLTQRVDAKTVLAMEREEMIDLLLTSHWDDDAKARPTLIRVPGKDAKYLIASDDKQLGYFLVWNGTKAPSTIDERVHNVIIREASAHNIRPPYYVYARYEDYQTEDIRFFKIPDTVLRHVGLSESRDVYNEEQIAH